MDAGPQPPVDEGGEAEAGAQRDQCEVGPAGRGAPAVFPDGGEVHVVGYQAVRPEDVGQLREEAGPAHGRRGGPAHGTAGRVRYPRHGHHHGRRRTERETRVGGALLGDSGDRARERARGPRPVRRPQPGQDAPVQVRHGGLHPAGELHAAHHVGR